ncbi:MAG TPA: hypothetical protein VK961_14220 [Chthoniobacter sp.]|nr:hypothetical protein [Chthoniobacter sp.]
MKTRLALLASLLCLALLVPIRADDAGVARVYLRDLEQQVAKAKEKPDAMYAWLQSEMTLQGLEEVVPKLSAADKVPYQKKIDEYKPLITAGASRNRATMIVRNITDTLQSAREDIAAGNNKLVNLQEAYFDRLDRYFTEKDLSSLPPAELKKLKDNYAEVRKGAK